MVNNITDNKNYLTQNSFKFVCDRITNCTYFCQSANLPGFVLGSAIQPTSFIDVPLPGDKLVVEDLSIKFIVDEDLTNWFEIYNWLISLGFNQNYEQYNAQVDPTTGLPYGDFSDCTLHILSNKLNANFGLTFVDCVPIALSSIEFDNTVSSIEPILADATFKFSYYKIEKQDKL